MQNPAPACRCRVSGRSGNQGWGGGNGDGNWGGYENGSRHEDGREKEPGYIYKIVGNIGWMTREGGAMPTYWTTLFQEPVGATYTIELYPGMRPCQPPVSVHFSLQ